ncbi:hypothetical protein LINPERHAP2_LOCUS42497 [Linum perenne]
MHARSLKPIQFARHGPGLSHLFFVSDLVLFVEASIEQADVILECLDRFCRASSQSISLEKFAIFFSKVVLRSAATPITNHIGILMTRDLERYLDVPILHGRTSDDTYQGVLDRINHTLTS